MATYVYILITIFSLFLVLIILGEVFIRIRGDCNISLDKSLIKKTDSFFKDAHTIIITIQLEFINNGKQQGLIIDCLPSLKLNPEKQKNLKIHSRIKNLNNPRTDGYWEACILKEKKELPVEIILEISSFILKTPEILNQLKEISIDLNYKYYGRTPLVYKKEGFIIDLSGLIPDKQWIEEEITFPSKKSAQPDKVKPIRTHLLKQGENLAEVIKKYVKSEASPGDIIAIAESALAIIQKRIRHVEEIKPCYLAKKINRFFDKDSSLSSVYSLEMAFREIGVLRILLATFIGLTTKSLGIKGGFYKIAGRQVTAIDDCTGTIPPYDKYIVLSPINLKETVKHLKEKTSFEIAIVDVNDLKRVNILACTCPEHKELIHQALRDNPQGNANEQTPLVLIKTRH